MQFSLAHLVHGGGDGVDGIARVLEWSLALAAPGELGQDSSVNAVFVQAVLIKVSDFPLHALNDRCALDERG